MLILFIGMAEMIFSTLWAKYVQEARVWASTLITMSHVFVWYFVLKTVIEQLNNMNVVFMYAIGCGLGNMLAIVVGEYFVKRAAHKKRTKKQMQLDQQTATVSAMPALITYDIV